MARVCETMMMMGVAAERKMKVTVSGFWLVSLLCEIEVDKWSVPVGDGPKISIRTKPRALNIDPLSTIYISVFSDDGSIR